MITYKSREITQDEYWLKVSECPLDVWERCFEDGYHHLRKSILNESRLGRFVLRVKGLFYKQISPQSDYDAWDEIFINFIDKVGLDPRFEKYINNVKKLILMQCDFVESQTKREGVVVRDRKLLNRIKMLEAEITKFEKSGNSDGLTIDGMLVKLGKHQGYKIKKKETTVLEYFELINDLK